MTYTALGITAVGIVLLIDWFGLRTRLITRKAFWVSYLIIGFFQFVTNGLLTGFGMVRYNGDEIIGSSSPQQGSPPFIGDGRIVFAPMEDLMFGFALILLTLSLWVFWGRVGVQRTPMAGPPRLGPGRNRDREPSP